MNTRRELYRSKRLRPTAASTCRGKTAFGSKPRPWRFSTSGLKAATTTRTRPPGCCMTPAESTASSASRTATCAACERNTTTRSGRTVAWSFSRSPRQDRGYFNFEFNCGGAFLCCYITDPERTAEGFKEFVKVPPDLGRTIQARSSLPPRIELEITEPVVWTLGFFIPFALFEHYLGPLGSLAARCGAATSSSARTKPHTRTGPRGLPWTNSTSTAPTASGRSGSLRPGSCYLAAAAAGFRCASIHSKISLTSSPVLIRPSAIFGDGGSIL